MVNARKKASQSVWCQEKQNPGVNLLGPALAKDIIFSLKKKGGLKSRVSTENPKSKAFKYHPVGTLPHQSKNRMLICLILNRKVCTRDEIGTVQLRVSAASKSHCIYCGWQAFFSPLVMNHLPIIYH